MHDGQRLRQAAHHRASASAPAKRLDAIKKRLQRSRVAVKD